MKILLVLLLLCNSLFSQYTVQNVPFTPQIILGNSIPMSDDAATGTISIGFVFCFWGNLYSQAYIGTNGWVSFSPAQPIAFTPFPIPTLNAFTPKNCVMSPFHDMNPGYPSQLNYIKYYTTGIAPFRRFIVTWEDIPMYLCVASTSKQQVVLYETTNIIETTIFNKAICNPWVNGRATHGLHNFDGTQAVVVGTRNATTWGLNLVNETTRFTPDNLCICTFIPFLQPIIHE